MSDVDQGGVSPIGDRLKAAREAKGLSLADVASQTRIPTRHLQHIEDEQWDALPAATYSIGFARSYANAIGLNGNEIGAELREQLGATRQTYETPSYYEPADPARVPPRSLAIVAAVIALVLAIGYGIWRSASVDDGADISAVERPVPQTPVAPPPSAAQQPVVTADGPVVITATDEVWLRIYEAEGGDPLFEGIMQAGDRYQVPATAQAPQIRTGRPQAIDVTVGGAEVPPLGQPEQTISDVSLRAADLAARANAAPAGAAQPGLTPVQ